MAMMRVTRCLPWKPSPNRGLVCFRQACANTYANLPQSFAFAYKLNRAWEFRPVACYLPMALNILLLNPYHTGSHRAGPRVMRKAATASAR